MSFSDLFAGTSVVGRYFKEKGHQVMANDLQYYSYVLNQNYIGNHTDLHFVGLMTEVYDLMITDIVDRKSLVLAHLQRLP